MTATDIAYGPVPDSVFDFSKPPGVTVHDIKAPTKQEGSSPVKANGGAEEVDVAYPVNDPAQLAGMSRSEVRQIEVDGHHATLITYGKGLAGIAVIEQPSETGQTSQSTPESAMQLPTVSINGSTATELPTALGTLLHFTRGGLDYTVLGSVTPAVAETAARGL